jgi:hypothetical protein
MLLSIILGLLLSYIIYKKYNIQYKGPNSANVVKEYYKDNNNNYYKLLPEICICPI